MLAHHATAEEAHHHQHQRVQPNRRKCQPGVDGEHRRQRQGVGEHGVGEAEHGEAQQPAHVFDIGGGSADHFTAAGGLHPARFLLQQVIKNLLLEVCLHLAPHPENQHSGIKPRRSHHRRQGDDQGRLSQHILEGESILKVVDYPTHQ